MIRFSVALLMCVCMVGTAFADGGERLLKPEEKAFILATHKAAMALMPPAPAGWNKEPASLVLPLWLGLGSELHPVPLKVSCVYQKPAPEITAEDIEPQASDDFVNRIGQIGEKLQAAVEKGDQPEIQRLQAEIQKAAQGNPTPSKMRARIDDFEANSAKISLLINSRGADYDFAHEIQAPTPSVYAIRLGSDTPSIKGTSRLGSTFLFFGGYTKNRVNDTLRVNLSDDRPPSCKVHRLIVFIDASPEVADQFIARMDLKKIAALVNL